ncbi:permease-like cell division protein FtsX [Pectinatus brassicae]|uniref:Cell division protein FtsX n=1 Tax=Pectinatus brassicae TaxID=862415 RepID=A0A840UMZ4_9FIRM|nr:permease-like cell division protein FtsX [Pectinatus brassicae]MBB5335612.1 cell division transport system permease protein [Pectinatus brassicae]
MKFRTSEYFIKEVAISLKRNNWMSLASIGTVTISLFILGLFIIIVANLNRMASSLESQVQISVYLQDNITKQQRTTIEEDLKKLSGVEAVKYVSKDEAIKRFKSRLGDQEYLLTALDNTNPLPDAFEVTVSNPNIVKTASKTIEKFKGVDSAVYAQDVVEHLFELTKLVRYIGLAIIIFLAGATIFIISNTIRLTVFARRKEIAIMKYVGATDWFIRWPFLLEGIVLGFIGGALSAIFLRFAYTTLTAKIYDMMAFFPLIPIHPFLTYISIIIICSGIFIGALGSTISIKRFLEV